MNKKSFTLIELLVVIAIIGILAAIAMPSISNARAKARDSRRLADLDTFRTALEMYFSDHDQYPVWTSGCLENTSATSSPFLAGSGFVPKYIGQIPKDPLFGKGHCYYYITTANGSDFHLLALLEKNLQASLADGGTFDSYYEVFSRKEKLSEIGVIISDVASAMGGSAPSLQYLLTITKSGIGTGTVTATGINCGSDCNETYASGTSVTLTATVDSGSTFVSWSGGCTGTGTSCTVTMDNAKSVNAEFSLSDLVGYWKFDETSGTLIDSSGYNNNGTQHGGVTYGVTGKVGKALSFDGVDDYVQSPYMSVFNKHAFTVMGWIYPKVSKVDEPLLATGDTYGTDRYLQCIIRNSHAYFGFYSDDLQSPTTLPLNEWTFLACVWEGPFTRKRYIYINDKLDSQNISNRNLEVTTGAYTGNGVWVGNYANSYHNGLIDEVRIYNRALSADEISGLYSAVP